MTAIQLDDELAISESPWRGRIISLLVLLVGAFVVAGGLYFLVFKSDKTTLSRSTEEIPVARATINQTLTISGVADAQLSSNLTFQATGRVAAVNVKVGDAVTEGQVLASLESDDLLNAVQQAQANQRAAQLKLADLLDGATASELAAADQGLAAAQAGLTKAQNDYDTLTSGGATADVSAAEQGVSAAEAQLASAEANRQKLSDSPSDADIAAAESAVAAAQSGVTAAENSATSAENTVTTASASLKSAEHSYCVAIGVPLPLPLFCTTPAAPIVGDDATLMDEALSGANATLATGVIASNSTYLNAGNGAASAAAAVTSAEKALKSAKERLSALNDGPTSEETDAADAAVAAAQAGLAAAQDRLTTLQQGGTAAQRSSALAGVASANATVNAAAAKRDEAYRGATQNQADQARQAVQSAGLAVEAARIRLKNAQIVAPFDGVIASVNAKAGEFGGGAGSTTAPIVLLTPNLVHLKMNVQETDYASIKQDQGGVVLFDALPGKPYPFRVVSIGASPTSSSGVVTYQVDATLAILPGNPPPTQGMNGRGLITTESKPNVLVVPARAIRRRGTEQIVTVKRSNGDVEEQVVTTGATDSTNVEILSGLAEGDTVEVVTLSTAKPGVKPTAVPTIPGGLR